MRRLVRIGLYSTIALSLVLCVGVLSTIPLVASLFGGPAKVVESGRTTIPVVRKFDRIFPRPEHSISYYTGTYGPTTWNAKAKLHGRYILTMQFPISLNTFGRNRVVSHGEPRFYFQEVESVTRLSGGATSIRFTGSSQVNFGPAELKRLVESNGDWSVLGVQVRTDAPVPGFEYIPE